jgi:hypothetical protein
MKKTFHRINCDDFQNTTLIYTESLYDFCLVELSFSKNIKMSLVLPLTFHFSFGSLSLADIDVTSFFENRLGLNCIFELKSKSSQ